MKEPLFDGAALDAPFSSPPLVAALTICQNIVPLPLLEHFSPQQLSPVGIPSPIFSPKINNSAWRTQSWLLCLPSLSFYGFSLWIFFWRVECFHFKTPEEITNSITIPRSKTFFFQDDLRTQMLEPFLPPPFSPTPPPFSMKPREKVG